MGFDDTLTEVDFVHPILTAQEEPLLAASQDESDLEVVGLERSLVSHLISLFRKQET